MQKLSSSASNNSLRTCLQFLIIKVNEKSSLSSSQISTSTRIPTPTTNVDLSDTCNSTNIIDQLPDTGETNLISVTMTTNDTQTLISSNTKKRKSYQKHFKQLSQKQAQPTSPSYDQVVSSTQDQVVYNLSDQDDCQSTPVMLNSSSQNDEQEHCNSFGDNVNYHEPLQEVIVIPIPPHMPSNSGTNYIESRLLDSSIQQPQSSHSLDHKSNTTSPTRATSYKSSILQTTEILDTKASSTSVCNNNSTPSQKQVDSSYNSNPTSSSKRKRTSNNLDPDSLSTASWSSYNSPLWPDVTSPATPQSCHNLSSPASINSSNSSIPSLLPSATPSPDLATGLKRPRLKLSEQKIRKIQRRPISFDDEYYTSGQYSFASTPTTSSGCSPGQHSSTTQSSDPGRSSLLLSTNNNGFACFNNTMTHVFQAPPRFINYLNCCNPLPKPHEAAPKRTNSPCSKDVVKCAICGIKVASSNKSRAFGQNSCLLCKGFFESFLKNPQQLYCAQDGDCLMTFDSRCQACWIKICLQKFRIEDEDRKTGFKYSPKLLSSPTVSLITIDIPSFR